jgi:putative FmdB family regulatory protein
MPIYEYYCENCNEEIEVIQKFSDDPMTQCPSCSENTLKKKTSMAAFHLKGGGWYKDGYGDENKTSKSDVKPTNATASSKPEIALSDSKAKSGQEAKTKSEPKASSSESTPKSKAS